MFDNGPVPGRNDACWCGSGKKYKKCHSAFDERLERLWEEGWEVLPRTLYKTPADIEGIKRSAAINVGVLDYVGEHIAAGMTTNQIDQMIYDYTVEHGGTPADLNYEGYPKSVCTSINDVVCHGIPCDADVLHEGDIIKHGTELARRVTKITAAWTNNRVNGNGDGLTGGPQHAVRRRQPALFGCRTQFNAVSPVILRGDGTLHAVTANLQQRHVILLKFHQTHHHDMPSVFSPGGNSHLLRLTGNDLLNGPGMKLHRDLPVRDGQRRVG